MNRVSLSFPDTVLTEEWVGVEKGVSLKVFKWLPTEARSTPVVFVSGWVSAVSGWRDLLATLTALRPVYYVETREKKSARIQKTKLGAQDFSIPRMAADLVAVCRHYRLDESAYFVMGSSLGATALLEALKKGKLGACGAFLVGPNSAFEAPGYIRVLIWLPAGLYHILKYFVLWYLRRFRVDARREPEQMKRYDETLKNANPQRIKLSALSAINMKYRVWPDIETIRVPVAIAFAPTDTLHSQEAIYRMAEKLPAAELIHCPTNRYMHRAEMMADIEKFLASLET